MSTQDLRQYDFYKLQVNHKSSVVIASVQASTFLPLAACLPLNQDVLLLANPTSVSYTHLTLPTIYSV